MSDSTTITDADRPASRPAVTGTADDRPAISVRGLRKTFGSVVAVESLDLDIRDGEFFAMLGPSGSGKTTVLRMIAGFEVPTAGTIRLSGVDATRLPPFRRNVNTVFQDYALFPHMTVVQNVGYGLRVKRVPAGERKERVRQALELVRLGDLGERRPSQLSGGQRQRVALARALVNRPAILLLDEPLGALDLKLREQMQLELKSIQREVGITFVFVTHDQHEALTLCDRLAVFRDGRVEQVGTAQEVYQAPASRFVAEFVGTSNIIDGPAARTLLGSDGMFALRPERIAVLSPDAPVGSGVTADGVVDEVVYAGAETRVVVAADAGVTLTAVALNASDALPVARGERVRLQWPRDAAWVIET
jgi:putative spermidine/putrescine transport system ATP-binding protein